MDSELNIRHRESENQSPTKKQVAMGVESAARFVISILGNETIQGKKGTLGHDSLKEVHRRVMFYHPGVAGQFRGENDVRIGGTRPADAEEIADRVYLFESWLTDELASLSGRGDSLYEALRIASAAHFCIGDEIHPFDDGNGRVARILMNYVLMTEVLETRPYGQFIIPVPILREYTDEREIARLIEMGKTPKLAPYLQAIQDIKEKWELNPFEVYLAGKWREGINHFLGKFRGGIKRSRLNEADMRIINIMEERANKLDDFMRLNLEGNYQKDKVPVFKPRIAVLV